MKRLKHFRSLFEDEDHNLKELPWEKNPKIGWWKDHSHLTMYHGTHHSRLASIAKHGIKAPSEGSTKGWVSMTHDPHTAHGYASMHGGESSFRQADAKAKHVPHQDRRVVVAHIPHEWASKNMNSHMRGNMDKSRDRLNNKSLYDQHKASGKTDSEYYQTSELRFKNHIPPHFLKGFMRKPT